MTQDHLIIPLQLAKKKEIGQSLDYSKAHIKFDLLILTRNIFFLILK